MVESVVGREGGFAVLIGCRSETSGMRLWCFPSVGVDEIGGSIGML
ncbi:hypothetical protein SAMN06265361_101694 [Laceyella tengchongensis]|uniref:Uncharacterized protein n=1 Tax=Laceyella tengchongensis TaxID=574699 RepID=A0AA45WK90_9BACL|nr:hypothetical protein SAMN06265361_101694 [Laceyella tengchongensis]